RLAAAAGRRHRHGGQLADRGAERPTSGALMDILYLLIPLSVVLVLLIVAVFGWAVNSGQLEDLAKEGERILLDEDQVPQSSARKESSASD
ncbi:cbb3-type cytochrome oxidase assembly protein CcoS, partial [Acinetobacter baumannii]